MYHNQCMSGDRALSFLLFATSLILAVTYTPVRKELRAVVAFVTAGRIGGQPAKTDRPNPAPEEAAEVVKYSSSPQQ
jgi:hypothetical protein